MSTQGGRWSKKSKTYQRSLWTPPYINDMILSRCASILLLCICYLVVLATAAQWLQMAKTNQKWIHLKWVHKFFQLDFSKFTTISVSRDYMRFILKICQTVEDIRMISQFHEFLNIIFSGFFDIWPYCEPASLLLLFLQMNHSLITKAICDKHNTMA